MKKNELTAWLIYGRTEPAAPAGFAASWRAARKAFRFEGKAGEAALVLDGPSPSLLLGVSAPDLERAVFEAALRAVETARRQKLVGVVLGGVRAAHHEVALRGLAAGRYAFRIGGESPLPPKTRLVGASPVASARAQVIAAAASLARTLVNLPPGEKYPERIVRRIGEELRGDRAGVTITSWNERKLAKEKCGGITAVGRGSANPPRLLRLDWKPRGARRHIVLVGKGITFDAGGLNIKPFEGMKTMKCDMAGAAAVVGAFQAAVRLRIPVRLTALCGFAENMLGAAAYKPGDVLTIRGGKTVEVLNTDAEGRLLLADLLDIACALEPDAIVDCATLTGACMVALGEEIAGVFGSSSELVSALVHAGGSAGELLWPMPLNRDFREKMRGEISDLKNIGGRYGGACTAAAFLSEFTGDRAWAHIDLAGPSFREVGTSGRPAGGTGFGVATLVYWLMQGARA